MSDQGREAAPEEVGPVERVPCSVIRGGTSKCVFFRADALPDDPAARDRVILSVMGSPDRRQVNGLGGADPLTSKIAVVEPLDDPAFDVRYTFGQVNIDEPVIDYDGNCGNCSAAIGYFSIRNGWVDATDPVTRVDIRHEPSGAHMINEVPTEDGTPRVTGEFSISGVPGSGPRVNVGFRDPGGDRTGTLLPTGSPRDTLEVDGRSVPCSVVDAGNPCLFLRASDFGLAGTELPDDLDSDDQFVETVESVRTRMAVRIGLTSTETDAAERALPLVVFLGEPAPYEGYTGETVAPTDYSLLARMMFMRRLHKAYAGTGAVCTAVANQVDGTLVSEFARPTEADGRTELTIGHPSGTMETLVETDREGRVEEALFARTTQPVMEGTAYATPHQVRLPERR